MNDAYKSFDPSTLNLTEQYEIAETGDVGCNSGRTRFSIKCKKCGQVLHENTTWPPAYAEQHKC